MLLDKELIQVLSVIKKQEYNVNLFRLLVYPVVKKKSLMHYCVCLSTIQFKKKVALAFMYHINLMVPSMLFLNNSVMSLLNFLVFFKNKIELKINYFIKKSNCYTILRAPFVHKKSREQLGIDKYYSKISLNTGIKKIVFVEYLENLFKEYIKTLYYLNIVINKKIFIN